jgi:hypothetical protein
MYLPLLIVLAILAVSAFVRRLHQEPQRRAQIISVVMVGVVVAELWLFGIDYNPTIAPPLLYPTPELVDFLMEEREPAEDEPYRVLGTGLALVPNVSMIFGLQDIRGYDPIAPRRYMELLSSLEGASRVGHHLLFTHADAPLIDFLNVRYAFATGELEGRWTPLQESQGVTLYANQQAMPRAFMVYTSRAANTPDESLEMTLAPDFDFRSSVVLEGAGESLMQGQEMPPVPTEVEITAYAPGEFTIQVDTSIPGILVLSEPYTTGWVASVDGEATEIWIANHAFRAVKVPEGSHTVRFNYRPISFVIGVWMSGIGLAALIIIPLLAWRAFRQDTERG